MTAAFDGPQYESYKRLCAQLGLKRLPTLADWMRRLSTAGAQVVLLLSAPPGGEPAITCVLNPDIEAGNLVGRWGEEKMMFGAPTYEEAAALAWGVVTGTLPR